MKNHNLLPSFAALVSAVVALLAGRQVQADYQSIILSDAPAGYWRLGEMPMTLADPVQVTNRGSLGEAANGLFSGYVARQEPGALAGSDDRAFRFWGNIAENSRVTFGSASSFNFTGTTPFTLEIWAKPMSSPTGSQRLIANGSSGVGYGFTLQGNNTLRMTAFGVADVTSDALATPFASNQWYHLALVRSNAFVHFYLNGAPVGNPKPLANIKTTTNPLTLGRTAAGAEAFTGVLDEAAVFDRVLTPAQIAAHYGAGQNNGAGFEDVILADSPIGYWRLNEPRKIESTSSIANLGALGADANGSVFGSLNSVTGGVTGPLTGDVNPAMGFGGTDGRIDVPFVSSLNTTSFTVECWARLDGWSNVHQSPVTSRYSGPSTRGYILYAAPVGGLPRWEFWNGTATAWQNVNSGGADVTLGKWTHLVGSYDAATRTKVLYVDGQLAAGAINVALGPNLTTPLRIGAGSSELTFGQYFWNGAVDEVAVYPAALSRERVQAHYEAATGLSPAMIAPPGVAAEPAGQTNWAPYPVAVSCVITGSVPMQLQWYYVASDGMTTTAVPNATNLALTLASTAVAQTGNYFLTATNALGTAASAWAWVEIVPLAAPTFTLNAPAAVPVYVGGTAGIPVMTDGTPPIAYQWQSNSVELAGATNSILRVPNVQPSWAAASFRAQASNPASTITSDPAQLQVLTPPMATYAAALTGMGPRAYWRLGEAAGSVAFDYWGGQPAIYENVIQGAAPGALLDNDDGGVTTYGSGSFIRSLSVDPFNFVGIQPFTLATWVKVDEFPATGAARIFSNRRQVGVTGGYGLGFIGNNTLRFTGYGVTDVNASVPSFAAGQWYHIVAVRSNTMVYLYIDGALKNSGLVANINPSIYPLQLGGNPNFATAADEEPFNGTIDDAAVFDRALSSGEIGSLYAARYGSLVPPTITRDPTPAVTYAGGTARFQVQASGSQPLGFAWKTNGIAIAGATNSSLVIAGVTLANSGVNYSVAISNQAGTLTSANALLTVLQPAGYTAAVLADHPVALWRLGEAGGPVAYDSWGGFNGQDNGAVSYGAAGALAGEANTAAAFDGSGSKVDVPYAADLNPRIFSAECWARVTGGVGTYRCAVATRDEVLGSNQKGFIIYATAANVWSFWTSTGAGWQTLNGSAVILDEWTHLVAVYNGQTKYFYVNGVLQGTADIDAVPNEVRPLRIGAGRNELDTGDYFFLGNVDEVALYNTVLSPERIDHHYALGKYGENTGPFITRQPTAQTAIVGHTAALGVQAAGSPVLAYQWLRNGAPVTGATQATLTLPGVNFNAAGTYSVRVSNAVGSVTSEPATLAVGAPPTFANVTNNLVLHLKLENNTQDASGRNNHGTPSGSPTFVPGRLGQALHYRTEVNVAYDFVSLGVPADLQFGSNVNFSVAYWVRFTGTPNDLPFLGTAVNSYGGTGLTLAPGYGTGTWSWSLVGTGGNVSTGYATQLINDGAWHHLVHTFDRTGQAITYLDGAAVDARSIAAVGDIDTGNSFNLGQDPTGIYAEAGEADIDDVGIWTRVLSTYEAQSIYAAAQVSGQSFDTYGPVKIEIRNVGDGFELIWQAGTLLESTTVSGAYAPVAGATAPYHQVTPGSGAMFYRVRL